MHPRKIRMVWVHFLAATAHLSHQLKQDLYQIHLLSCSGNLEHLQPPFLWWDDLFIGFPEQSLIPHTKGGAHLSREAAGVRCWSCGQACAIMLQCLVLLVRVQRSAAMTAGSVSTLVGPWGTNNYELCCQQGTSNHSRTFHNSWAPATTFVLNTPAAGRLAQRRFKKLRITIETCFHNPRAQLLAVFCATDVPGGKNTPGWKRKWQLPRPGCCGSYSG